MHQLKKQNKLDLKLQRKHFEKWQQCEATHVKILLGQHFLFLFYIFFFLSKLITLNKSKGTFRQLQENRTVTGST